MSIRSLVAALLVACQGDPAPAPEVHSPTSIEATSGGAMVARVAPGHPCRATVAGIELLVGGPPLLATYGEARWTAETQSNGTTFSKNDRPVARIHANQLFDSQGIPLVRVLDDGSIVNGPGRVVRRATKGPDRVVIADLASRQEIVVTGTQDVVLAGLLAAPEPEPEIRALTACHLLLGAK